MCDYDVINSHLKEILAIIYQSGHVKEYDYLIKNRDLTHNREYRERYKCFWQMNGKGFSPEWFNLYFDILSANLNSPIGLGQVVDQLWQIPATTNGMYKLNFSFATKLVHMAEPHLPIYDKRVAEFYDFIPPVNGIFSQKLEKLMRFYNRIKTEYKRVLGNGLLTSSIKEFRERFSPNHCEDEKIIDYLVWACMKM